MDKKEEINIEMQEVGAYPTKQEMYQEDVPLLDWGGSRPNVTASELRQEQNETNQEEVTD